MVFFKGYHVPNYFPHGINPWLRIAEMLECPGFTFRIPIPDSEDLPECSSTILVLWDEPGSDVQVDGTVVGWLSNKLIGLPH